MSSNPRSTTRRIVRLGAGATVVSAAVFGVAGSQQVGAQTKSTKVIVGLITKTDTNPFFVKMKEGAEKRAKELGLELRSFAGKKDGDNATQVKAIETLIAAKAKGILITPSDSKAIVPTIAKARKAGILVIALDTPTDPASAVDVIFATDNFKAGELIGAGPRPSSAPTRRRPRSPCLTSTPARSRSTCSAIRAS